MPSQIQDKIGFETAICVDNGTQSNYLFGDDLPKRLKDAKEPCNVGLAINKSHSRSNNYRYQKRLVVFPIIFLHGQVSPRIKTFYLTFEAWQWNCQNCLSNTILFQQNLTVLKLRSYNKK